MSDPAVAPRPSRWKKVFRALMLVLALILASALLRAYFAFRDRTPGQIVSVDISPKQSITEPRPLRMGFGRVKINPDISNPKRPVWLAGFSQHRAATALHDDLWAIACVVDDGWHRIGMVAIDAIGFFNDDVVQVRRRLGPELKLDYTVVCSTHNHSTPDLLGLWGADFFHTGVRSEYREQVTSACAAALSEAATHLARARVAFHEIRTDPKGLVSDTRKPEVFDPDIRVMHFIGADSGRTLGSITGWGDHPETLWGSNTEVTSDFCGYLRDALEKGVADNGQTNLAGLGGIHLYVNGCIGGLMSTTPSTVVRDPFSNREFQKPSHEKARALGLQLATRIMEQIGRTNEIAFSDQLAIGIHARTLEVKLDNMMYLLAGYFGLMERGYVHWRTLRTEVALLTLGEASIACVPGEMYPEIANGGIEQPPGADYNIAPVEVPPLRELMPGKVKFVFGLANDEVGYLIPKTEWDQEPPYLYGAKRAPYGEVNSLGPDAAGAIHGALKKLCRSAEAER